QMRWYNVPWLSFINRMDRYNTCTPGANSNPCRVISWIRTKPRIPAAAVQVPIGVEDQLDGVVNLVRWNLKAIHNRGTKGVEVVESDEILASVLGLATKKRTELIGQLAEVNDGIA
ncbi:hypothetical protein BJV78DRAFT_1102009, partial [Lactifluus subvellereus]